MNRHRVIFKRRLGFGRAGRHEVRLSIPGTRQVGETARNLAEFEREELFRLYPGAVSDEAIIGDSVGISQYAYQVHMDGWACGICGVLPPVDGVAVVWYLATVVPGRRFRRLILPVTGLVIRFFGLLQPGARVYTNGFTRHNLKSLCFLKRLGALREENGFFVFKIDVKGG